MKLGIAEILEATSKIKDRQGKIDYLRKNNSNTLMTILDICFNPAIEFNLPEGTPPYKPSEVTDNQGMLYQETRRLYLFLKGVNSPLEDKKHDFKREMQWIGLLESVDKEDAKLLCAIKTRKMPWRPITLPLIQEAFPGFLSHVTNKDLEKADAA